MMQRLQAWLDQLGVAGVVGLGVLLFCVPFYFSALAPAERELEARRFAAERQKSSARAQPSGIDARAAELKGLYDLFPPLAQLPQEIERLYGFAREAKLELSQGEYRLESGKAGLVSYRVTLPVRGRYREIREFLSAVLRGMPIASLDTLRFERKRVGEAELEVQLHLTIYFSPHAAAPQTGAAEPRAPRGESS